MDSNSNRPIGPVKRNGLFRKSCLCSYVIGIKSGLTSNQAKCFELYRANQKNVNIVTYDELKAKLKGLHEVITGKLRK